MFSPKAMTSTCHKYMSVGIFSIAENRILMRLTKLTWYSTHPLCSKPGVLKTSYAKTLVCQKRMYFNASSRSLGEVGQCRSVGAGQWVRAGRLVGQAVCLTRSAQSWAGPAQSAGFNEICGGVCHAQQVTQNYFVGIRTLSKCTIAEKNSECVYTPEL